MKIEKLICDNCCTEIHVTWADDAANERSYITYANQRKEADFCSDKCLYAWCIKKQENKQ